MTTTEPIKNVNRVFEYLISQGWMCALATVKRHAKAGKIQKDEAGAFPVSGVDAYAAMHFDRIRTAAAHAANQDDAGTEPVQVCMELGLDGALERLRSAEVSAYAELQRCIEQGVPSTPIFRMYAQSVELLRKAEGNLLSLQREQRALLPASEVKEWMTRQIIASKTTLLNIPGKLAPQLEGLSWPMIQKRLENEIYSALEKLSADPCGPVGEGLEATGEHQPVGVGRGPS